MAAAGVLVAVLAVVAAVESRAVNISNTWVLPEDGFPVFYRYFRDRINWFEADAVCQFHHANLVTVDTGAQFDAARAFLKELDVLSPVWLGLKRGRDQPHFLWTSEQPLSGAGYWSEPLPTSSEELCAAADPAADFRWHGLSCGGLEVASFICELPVPDWAAARDGCMVENLPSLTAAFLPEEAAVELTSDCGLGGTRRVVCKGNTTREALYAQLNCHNMMNEDATLGPGSGSGMPPGSAQDAEQADPADQSEQPEPEADDAYTSTGTSTETSASTTPGDQTSTRQRRATTSASSAAREVTTDVSVDTSVPASSTENPSEPSTIAETVTTGPASPASAAPSSPAASSAVSSAVPATKAAVPSEAATPGTATTTSSPASSPAPGHPGTLIVARKDDQKEAAPAAASTAAPQAQAPAWTPEDKPIIVPIVAKKGPSFPKKVTAAGAKPFRPEKIPLKLRAPTAAPARTDDTAAPAPAAASTPRHDATSVAEAMDAADKISATAGVVPEQDKRAAQVPQLSAVADVIKLPATVNTDSDNKLEDTEFTNHMAGDAADDLDDALMIRELSSARTPLIKSVPVVDVPLDEPRTAAATAQPAAAETTAAATSTPVTATATKLSKESAVFLSLPVEGRVARRPPVKKDGLPAAIAGAAVTTTSTTTTTTTTPAPPSTAAPAATTADPNATTASPIRLRESMAGPGGKARTLTTAPPAPAEPGASTTTSTTTPAPTTSTSSTAAPTTTTASTTTAAAAQNASTAAPQHATDAPTTTAAPSSTARPEPANGEAPKERRRQHLPAPLLSMNMKPDSEDGEDGLESEPQSPPRPNRSRSLVSHQHRTFYPYFLNRVLGR